MTNKYIYKITVIAQEGVTKFVALSNDKCASILIEKTEFITTDENL